MSKDAPNWYVQQWKQGALHEYQSTGFTLKNATMPPIKITGEKLHWRIAGSAEAEEDVKRGDQARPMNQPRNKVEMDHTKDRAFDLVHEDDLDQMGIAELQDVYKTSAMALGRLHDKKIVRALNQATQTVGDYAQPFSLALLLKASQTLQANDVPWAGSEIFCAVDSVAWNMLLTFKQFSSSDYVGPALPYTSGNTVKTWNNIHVMQLSDSILRENDADNQSTSLMWARSAMGFGNVRELKGDVVWDNWRDAWTHNMRMRNGAKLILPKGAVKIQAKYDPDDIDLAA